MALLSDVTDMLGHCGANVSHDQIAPAIKFFQEMARYVNEKMDVQHPIDIFLKDADSDKRGAQTPELLAKAADLPITEPLAKGFVRDLAEGSDGNEPIQRHPSLSCRVMGFVNFFHVRPWKTSCLLPATFALTRFLAGPAAVAGAAARLAAGCRG